MNTLENIIETSFSVRLELEELTTSGVLNFETKMFSNNNSFWKGTMLIIPVYGLYKVSWGFYQNALETFYNNTQTSLSLKINSEIHKETATITRKTASSYSRKESHKTVTLLLRENETLSLKAEVLDKNNPKMKDIYFNIEKL
ncbi:MAG: hypothetical protein V3V28_13755 [Polaribacter sp.]|uniref:hypothetical protein n=1 Tax=Polaribacter sp. TaxID=1920175 RepID=UPI002F3576DE